MEMIVMIVLVFQMALHGIVIVVVFQHLTQVMSVMIVLAYQMVMLM